jgi:hypothetical protein
MNLPEEQLLSLFYEYNSKYKTNIIEKEIQKDKKVSKERLVVVNSIREGYDRFSIIPNELLIHLHP